MVVDGLLTDASAGRCDERRHLDMQREEIQYPMRKTTIMLTSAMHDPDKVINLGK